MMNLEIKINKAAQFIKRVANNPRIGMILDSTLQELIYEMEDVEFLESFEYHEIFNFPEILIGEYIMGSLQGKKVLCTKRDVKSLNACSPQEMELSINLLKKIGIKFLIVVNSIHEESENFNLGDLMLVKDNNILNHKQDKEEIIQMVKAIADMLDIDLKESVYRNTNNLTYALSQPLDCDVNKSISEVTIANRYGINVLEMSLVTDTKNNKLENDKLNKCKENFITLIKEIIAII